MSNPYPPSGPQYPQYPQGPVPASPASPYQGAPYQAPYNQAPARSDKGKNILWILMGCSGVLLLLCCGGVGTLAFIGYNITATEKPGVDAELTAYFNDLKNKDIDSAYGHFSMAARLRQTKEQFATTFNSPVWQSFDQYDSYQTTGFQVVWGKPVAAGEAEGTSAKVSGNIQFMDGRTGTFNATMEKTGEQWRIFSIDVNAAAPANAAQPAKSAVPSAAPPSNAAPPETKAPSADAPGSASSSTESPSTESPSTASAEAK